MYTVMCNFVKTCIPPLSSIKQFLQIHIKVIPDTAAVPPLQYRDDFC